MRRLGIVCACAALALVAACGSEESSIKLPKHTASSTPSASPSTSGAAAHLPAGMTRPEAPTAQQDTLASAKEFTRYALQLMQFSFASRDVALLRGIVADWSGCASCQDDAASVRKQKREHYAQVPARLPTAEGVYVTKKGPARYSLVTTFQMPAGRKVGDDGSVLGKIPPARGSLDVDLRWAADQGTWQLEDYELTYGG